MIRYILFGLILFNALALSALATVAIYIWAAGAAADLSRAL